MARASFVVLSEIEHHLALRVSGLSDEGIDALGWHTTPPQASSEAPAAAHPHPGHVAPPVSEPGQDHRAVPDELDEPAVPDSPVDPGDRAVPDELDEPAVPDSPVDPGDPVDAETRRCQALLEEVEAQQLVIVAAQAAQARALAAWVQVLSEPEVRDGDAAPGTGTGTGTVTTGGAVPGDVHGASLRAALAADAIGVVAEEVTASLRLTPWSADRLVETATRMVQAMPMTIDALDAGLLDWRRATTITAATAHLDDDAAAAVDATLCGAGGTGLEAVGKKLTRAIDAAIHAADAQALARRSRIRTAERGVRTRPVGDGQSEMVVTGPATAVASLGAVIDALGRESIAASRDGQGDGDPYAVTGVDGTGAARDARGIDAHRFDALHELLTATPRRPGSSAPVAPVVLISLSTLLGADDAPAHLSGYGLLPAWLARQAAGDARLRRVLTDPFTGTVIGVDGHTYPPRWFTPPADGGPGPGSPGPGSPACPRPPDGAGNGDPERSDGDTSSSRSPAASTPPAAPGEPGHVHDPQAACTRVDPVDCPVARAGGGPYRIPAGLDRLLRARWDTCTAPGCSLSAVRCDLDHVIAHPAGATCACNLAPLCRRHHRMKHGTNRPPGLRTRTAWRRSGGTRRQRWHVHRCLNGHQHWTSPLGRSCVVAPHAPLTTRSGERVHLAALSYPTRPAASPAAVPRDTAERAAVRRGAPVTSGSGHGHGYGDLDPHHPAF